MRFAKPIVSALIALSLTECAYSPLEHDYLQWVAGSCGRKTFGERICSGSISIVLLPVWALAFVADIPLGILESWFGVAPLNDPLIKTAGVDFNNGKRTRYVASNGDVWTVERDSANPALVAMVRTKGDLVIESIKARPASDGQVEIVEHVFGALVANTAS